MARTTQDLAPEEIRFLLNRKGLTFADVDRKFGLPVGTARSAARKPSLQGETAITSVLGLSPRHIWPSRYEPSGDRLKPQPSRNYTCPPKLGHCEKGEAA